MKLRIGGRYRYKIGSYVVDTYFVIENTDGITFTGRARDWTCAIWYFDSQGRQIGTEQDPDGGVSSISLVLEDDNEEDIDHCSGSIASGMLHESTGS